MTLQRQLCAVPMKHIRVCVNTFFVQSVNTIFHIFPILFALLKFVNVKHSSISSCCSKVFTHCFTVKLYKTFFKYSNLIVLLTLTWISLLMSLSSTTPSCCWTSKKRDALKVTLTYWKIISVTLQLHENQHVPTRPTVSNKSHTKALKLCP